SAQQLEKVRNSELVGPTVAVVGQTKSGKSSLINAMLAAPGLSSVETGEVAKTCLLIQYGPQWTKSTIGFPLSGKDAPTLHADRIETPIPFLERMSLVDTPGCGGADTACDDLAIQVGTLTTAALFVTDASAPLNRVELNFLFRIAEKVETVLCAITKIDV